MTTRGDNYPDRILRFGKGRTDGEGTSQTAFGDPSGAYPRSEYYNNSSLNAAIRGGDNHQLATGGSAKGVDLDLTIASSTQYGMADVRETASGHVIELNDTPGGERVLIKHNTGAGIEMKPDGTILVVTTRNKVEICEGDNTIIVEGDANLNYRGNLTLNVQGDFAVNCNNYTVNARGDKTETINGNQSQSVHGNKTETIAGSTNEFTAKSKSETILGDNAVAIKGVNKIASEGKTELVSGGDMVQTSETKFIASSPDMNIAGTSLSVFGSTGTIGGEGITTYTQNIFGTSGTFTAGMTAPTFHGDLDGTADVAATSLHQSYADGSGPGYSPSTGSRGSITDTATDDTETAQPTSELVTSYLEQSANGVRAVAIDVGDYMKNTLQQRELTLEDIRSKMKEQNFRDNANVIADQIARGVLSSNFAEQMPSEFGEIRSTVSGAVQRGRNIFGNLGAVARAQTFRINERRKQISLPPPASVINAINTKVESTLRLADGITIGKFIGGVDTGDFAALAESTKQAIARNYAVHAQLIASKGPEFINHRLEVVEGFFQQERYGIGTARELVEETLTSDGILDLRSKGRAVVYELYDQAGKIDIAATYNLAQQWADVGYFDKLTLAYDNYDPLGNLHAQIIVEIPEIASFDDIRFGQTVETAFNNVRQSADSLIFIPK